jgi:cytosine deaminase
MANLYANVLQIDRAAEMRECFRMLTDRSAALLNFRDYGIVIGNRADVVVIDAQSPEQAVAEIAQPVAVFKNGRRTVQWDLPTLMRPR